MINPLRLLVRGSKAVIETPRVVVRAVESRIHMAILMGVARHLLTGVGGALVAQGITTQQQSDEAMGAVLTLIGIVASIWAKRKA